MCPIHYTWKYVLFSFFCIHTEYRKFPFVKSLFFKKKKRKRKISWVECHLSFELHLTSHKRSLWFPFYWAVKPTPHVTFSFNSTLFLVWKRKVFASCINCFYSETIKIGLIKMEIYTSAAAANLPRIMANHFLSSRNNLIAFKTAPTILVKR